MVSAETYYFILGSLILLRLLGFVIFFDFYRKNKELRFFHLSLATLFYALSPIIDLFIQDISGTSTYDFLYFISELTTVFALILFIYVFIQYTSTDNSYRLWFALSIILIMLVLTYPVIGFELSIFLVHILNLFLILITIAHIIRKWGVLAQIADNSAYFFFLSAIIIVINLSVSFIAESPETEFLQYTANVAISLLAIFIFVHLEYNRLSIQKYLLKDDYSHAVAQILQSLIGRLETSQRQENNEAAKTLIEEAIEDCLRVGDQLAKIRKI